MRVDKSGLDDSVVEDGEATTILISDDKTLTTKNRDMKGRSTHLPNGLQGPAAGCCKLTGELAPHQRKNGVVVGGMSKTLREPVEDCEEEEEGGKVSSGSGNDDVLDSLTHSMKGISIQETVSSTELEGRMTQLTVKDDNKEEEEEEDTRCSSLQSQSSIITVDPPSLPHEEEEEKSEVADDLAPRGPTAGKPTSYRPSQDNFNRVASKAYSSHNLDRFHNQISPFVPPPQTSLAGNGGYVPVEFDQNRFFPPPAASAYGTNEMGAVSGGKRGVEDEEDTPFKYTRPVEEMVYDLPQSGTGVDGQDARKHAVYFSQVSLDFSCGGNVVDTSLSPEEELARSIKEPRSHNISYEPQLSITDLDNMLETIEQMEKAGGSPRDHDPGYASENSPHSDSSGSPGSSPKSVFSPPMRPSSIMSQDSGIASPFSEEAQPTTVLPSPPEDAAGGQSRTWVENGQSPPGGTAYHSPPSVSMYHSPSSVTSAMSPPSVSMYHSPSSVTSAMSPASVSTYHSPSSVTSAMSPASVTVYQNPPSVTMYQNHSSVGSAMSPASMSANQNPPSMSMYRNPPSMATYPSPSSVASVMSPYSIASSDDLSMTSAPSPIDHTDSHNDYIFNARKEELRDALDVIAEDLTSMNDRRKVGQQVSSATQKTRGHVSASVSPAPSNLPVSVTQQKNGRPEKLPIAPLPKSGRPGAGGVQQQQQSPVVNRTVPVMVMPNTMPVPPSSTSATPVTSAPLLVVNQVPNQTPMSQMILVLPGNNQQAAAAIKTQTKKLREILPRPGPAISDSAPKPNGVKAPVKADLPSVPKQEVSVSGGGEAAGNGGVVAAINGARPVPPVQSSPRPQPGPSPPCSAAAGKKAVPGRHPPQSKMLNIARRLVASMTTTDLQFQDCEGDTYLHVSVCKADKNMVQALLERLTRENLQAMINTQNLMRQTPLYLAVSANSPEMVSLLIQYGADVNVFAEHTRMDGKSKEVKAALHCAASHGQSYLPTLQALLAARELNIDQVNSDGHTALHCAILEHSKANSEGGIINSLPIIQVLVKHGADPNAQGKKSGKTALMYALESRDLNLIEHVVALIDPVRLRIYLKAQAFDGSTCQRIMENLQRTLDDASRQRLHVCFRIKNS